MILHLPEKGNPLFHMKEGVSFTNKSGLRKGAALGDSVLEATYSVNFASYVVACLEPKLGCSRHANTWRSTGEDQVPRVQSEDVRQIRNQLGNLEDQLFGV